MERGKGGGVLRWVWAEIELRKTRKRRNGEGEGLKEERGAERGREIFGKYIGQWMCIEIIIPYHSTHHGIVCVVPNLHHPPTLTSDYQTTNQTLSLSNIS